MEYVRCALLFIEEWAVALKNLGLFFVRQGSPGGLDIDVQTGWPQTHGALPECWI